VTACFIALAVFTMGGVASIHAARAGTSLSRTGAILVSTAKPKHKRHTHSRPLPVGLSMAIGFYNSFREGTLVPVRMTLQSRSAATLSGAVEIPDVISSEYPASDQAIYQMAVTLPPYATKRVTVYVPAFAISGTDYARFVVGGKVDGAASAYPSQFSQAAITVGDLAGDPTAIAWIKRLSPGGGRWVTPVRLTPATLDPIAPALANYDAIVIGDAMAGSLNSAQLGALGQYVQNGGGLIVIGGPAWQQSLKPLPPALVPGVVTGTRVLSGLSGLGSIAGNPRTAGGRTVLSVLSQPRGTILASQNGIPLAVDDAVGQGHILYLAFDPNLAPMVHWPGAAGVLSRLLIESNPESGGRPNPQQGSAFLVTSQGIPGNVGAATELDNLPSPALSWIIGFVALTSLFILILGPLSFLVLGRLRRRELAWISVPIGAIVCTGATFGVAGVVRDRAVLVNTMTVVTLDGSSASRPVNIYAGLFAPIPGNYRVSVTNPAYVSSIAANPYEMYFASSFGGRSASSSQYLSSADVRLQEGEPAAVDFLRMDTWSMHNAEISTTVKVPGTVQNSLHVDSRGYISGWVRNGTNLNLTHPYVIAGRKWIRLPDMAPGRRVPVSILPRLNIYNYNNQSIWTPMFGQVKWRGYGGYGYQNQFCLGACVNLGSYPGSGLLVSSGPRFCCVYPYLYAGSSLIPWERSLTARLRNVAELVPEAQTVQSLGEILFVAWNQKALAPIKVNGATPDIREMNLIVQPLSPPALGPGRFHLRTGTFGARLVDVTPEKATSGQSTNTTTGIDIGANGSATFEFQLRPASGVHFSYLKLYVDAGGSSAIDMGQVWDWHAQRWVLFDLATGQTRLNQPNRFVSPAGTIRIKLTNYDFSRDLQIADFNRNLQISGAGYAER
jgi:hypothetical protein